MADVLITPVSGLVEFKDNSGVVDAIIQLDGSGNLNITHPGGNLNLGNAGAPVYIGNGVASVDVIFEQNGAVRALAGKTLTLGQTDSFVTVNSPLQVNRPAIVSDSLTATRLISNIATGTSPLTVASTTLVTNLNADLLDGLNSTAFAQLSGATFTGAISGTSLTLSGDLTVNGTTTTINSTTVTVDDKNLELGSVATPTDATADGGGITLKGATDKTFNWVSATGYWTSNQSISAPRFVSTQATGTSPLVVASTTLVTNLNADLLDGLNSATTNTASTIVARDASGNFAANIINPTQILQGTNTFIRDYASGYSTTITASTIYEIGRITFTGSSQNIAIVGEIRGGTGASVGVTRFILDLRSDTLPGKTFTLFEEEITNLGRLIRVKVYQDTATGLVVIGYSANSSLQNIGWSLKVQERGNYNYLQQTTTLTTLDITGLTEVALTSTNRTISSNFETSGTATATRLISNIATGTAPLTVASTTLVTNLNADLLDGNDSTYFTNATNLASGTVPAARMPAHTGDVTSSAGAVALTLATVNSNVGSFGSSSAIPVLTVNAKGLITAVSTSAVSIPSGSISVTGGDLTLSGTTGTAITNATLATVNSNTGSFGSATSVPVITVNAKGLVTAVTTATVTSLPSQTGNTGKFLTTNGSTASWTSTTAAAGGGIYTNTSTISTTYTIPAGQNGFSVGPITVANGTAITVSSGQRWVVI